MEGELRPSTRDGSGGRDWSALVGDGAGLRRDLVDAQAIADQGDHLVAADGIHRQVGDVRAQQIHGDAPDDTAALAGHQSSRGAAPSVIAAARAIPSA